VKQLFIIPALPAIVLTTAVLFFSFQKTASVKPPSPIGEQPKNIILLIGDGMGLTQITAGLYANGNSLHLENFPISGLIKTHSSSHLITDSGAGE